MGVNRGVPISLREFFEALYLVVGKDDSGELNVANIDSDGAQLVRGLIDGAIDFEIQELGSDNIKFDDITTDTGSFSTANNFGFTSVGVLIANDSSNDIDFSFNGSTVHGTVKANESIDLDAAQTIIYFKSTAGGDAVRYWSI